MKGEKSDKGVQEGQPRRQLFGLKIGTTVLEKGRLSQRDSGKLFLMEKVPGSTLLSSTEAN